MYVYTSFQRNKTFSLINTLVGRVILPILHKWRNDLVVRAIYSEENAFDVNDHGFLKWNFFRGD